MELDTALIGKEYDGRSKQADEQFYGINLIKSSTCISSSKLL